MLSARTESAAQMSARSAVPRTKAPAGERLDGSAAAATAVGMGDGGVGAVFWDGGGFEGGGEGDWKMCFWGAGGCGSGWGWMGRGMLEHRSGMPRSRMRKMNVDAVGERSCVKSAAALHCGLLSTAWFIVEIGAKVDAKSVF
jgi:hypothetical protein